jgi:hypothetical protein
LVYFNQYDIIKEEEKKNTHNKEISDRDVSYGEKSCRFVSAKIK